MFAMKNFSTHGAKSRLDRVNERLNDLYNLGKSDGWGWKDNRKDYIGIELEAYLAGHNSAKNEWLENGY